MLCQLSQTGFAVLPPTHDTLAFVDGDSNISRVESEQHGSTNVLGFKDAQDRVLLWSKGDSALRIKQQSGKEETIATVDGLASLTRFGEDAYCAYCETSEEGSIVIIRGEKLEERDVVLTRKRKVKDKSEAGPSTYCWSNVMVGAVLARRNHLYLVRRRREEGFDYERLVSFKSRFEVMCVAAAFTTSNAESGDVTICVGSSVGRIAIHRVQASAPSTLPPITSELHWHSSIVRTLSLVDENHLVSGGEEGVLVLWRIDRGTSATTFRPRLGASIIDSVVMRSSVTTASENNRSPSCVVLLDDGCALELEVPSLVLQRRIRAWIPSNSLCVAPVCEGNSADATSRYLAVALDNHRRGALTFIDADLRDSTAEERVIDVAGRNAVSTAEKESQWRLDEVQFAPEGTWFAAILSSGAGVARGGRKRELRIFVKDVEVLRVPLALPGADASPDDGLVPCNLAVSRSACAVSDPNACGKVVLFSGSSNGDFALERVYDVEPQAVAYLALSGDESCLAVLMKNGALRVFQRATTECVLATAVSTALNLEDEACLGVGFSSDSREIFVWTSAGIDALMSSSRLNATIFSASISATSSRVAFLKSEDSTEGSPRSLYTWSGGISSEPVRVDSVEPASDWVSARWAGDTIGWVLKRTSGSIHTRGGKHTFVPRRHSEKRLPLIKLRKDDGQKPGQQHRLALRPKVDASALFGTDWCKDVPSHLLQRPPTIEVIWPRNSQVVSSHIESSSLLKRSVTQSKEPSLNKRNKPRQGASEGLSAESVVEEQTAEEHELLVNALRVGANGKASKVH